MEEYGAYLNSQISDAHVLRFVGKYKSFLSSSKMFTTFDPDNTYFKAFVRVILANPHTLGRLFQRIASSSKKQKTYKSSSSDASFMFLLPKSGKKMCSPYYVSFTPLGVLYFLVAWCRSLHPNEYKAYMSDGEWKCVGLYINACRQTDTLVYAAILLYQNPKQSICDVISGLQKGTLATPAAPLNWKHASLRMHHNSH
jgi:hypothetical protein